MTAPLPLLVLVSSGQQAYRQYLLEQLASAFRVWLVTDEPVDWQRPWLSGWTAVPSVSAAHVLSAVQRIGQRHLVAGLLSWDERHIVVTADVAAELNLPGAGPQGVRNCRDKAVSRDVLRAAGLRQPRSRYCAVASDALAFAREVGYPVIVKPRGMGASIGVARVDGDRDLPLRFEEAAHASLQGAADYQHGALVEEFLDGPEISVDGRIVQGRYEALWVAHKRLGLPPHFEETGHLVDAADPLLRDPELLDTLQRAHEAVGFQTGVTHTELKLTAAGPVIVEINGRLGGDLIPYLATLATGLQPGRMAGEVAAGCPQPWHPPLTRAAAITFRYPDEDLTLEALRLPANHLTGDLEGHCVALAAPGAVLALPPAAYVARAAYAVAAGPNAEACLTLSTTLAQAVVLEPRVPALV